MKSCCCCCCCFKLWADYRPVATIYQLKCVFDRGPGSEDGDGLVAKSCPTLGTPWAVACQVPLSIGFLKQEYWSGCHFLLQGIFLTQESNPGLLNSRWILYRLS